MRGGEKEESRLGEKEKKAKLALPRECGCVNARLTSVKLKGAPPAPLPLPPPPAQLKVLRRAFFNPRPQKAI